MKKLVKEKSTKGNFNTSNALKKVDRNKSVLVPQQSENEKRKMTKAPTSPKPIEVISQKSEILVTPSKDYQSEIISLKKEESSILAQPSPAPRHSLFMTSTNLVDVANTSQIKVMARFRPLNTVEQVT